MANSIRKYVVLSVVFVLFAGLPAWGTELLTNGGFLTGDFTGWTTADQPGSFMPGGWFVSSGTSGPISGFPIEAPLNGLFDAQTDQGGEPGAHVLLQSFTIPRGATSVTLRFVLIRNNRGGGPFCPGPLDFTVVPNQCDRVDILTASASPFDTGAGVVLNIFTGALNIPPDGTEIWHVFEVPLTGLAPGTYQLRFGEVDNQGFNQMGVDNVSIEAITPSPVTPFATFTATVEIELRPRRDDAFDLKSRFTLGAGSNEIDPLTEDVTLELTGGTGSFITTIPAGSFTKDKQGHFEFEGTINGVDLQAKITRLGSNQFKCEVEGEHADLTGIANPVTVTLTIGADSGSTTVRAKFDHDDDGDRDTEHHERD